MLTPARIAPRLSHLQTWGAILLRFVLLISAWQGPIPWFHCHGSLASASEIEPWLVKHLRTHHGTVSLFANIDFGWHCHFDLPLPDSDDEPNEAPKAHVVICCSPTVTPVSVGSEFDVSSRYPKLPIQPLGTSSPEPTTAGSNQHFYDSFAESLALPLRFCVATI
jgi:hypothetical protein